MSEQEKREFAQHVAIQALYYAGRQDKGRLLTSVEMAQAIRTLEGFMAWFFGSAATSEGERVQP